MSFRLRPRARCVNGAASVRLATSEWLCLGFLFDLAQSWRPPTPNLAVRKAARWLPERAGCGAGRTLAGNCCCGLDRLQGQGD